MNPQRNDTGPISKLYMQLAIPLVFSMVITLVYNLTDTYFVAATDNTDLVAGVSLGSPVFTFLMALGNIFGQGGSSLLARLLGQNDQKGGRHVSAWCFYLTLIVGCVIGIVMLIAQQPMLSLLGADPETYSYARGYYVWLAIGAPFVVGSFVHTNLLRTEGWAKESMISTIGGAVVNIILDPVLISVVGLGAAGAAIATVIGYIFTVLYSLYIVKKKSACLSVSVKEISLSGAFQKQILSVGLAAAVTNIMQSFGVVFLNQALLSYGNDKIAAMGIAIKVSLIVLMIITGLTFGGQPLFGFYYGAKNQVRLRGTIRFAAAVICGTALGLSLLVFLFAAQLLSIFMPDPVFVQTATPMLQLQVVSMVFVGLIMLATVLFQSVGKALPALLLSLARQGAVFVGAIFLLAQTLGYDGILAAQAVSDVVTVILAAILFYYQFYPILRKGRT